MKKYLLLATALLITSLTQAVEIKVVNTSGVKLTFAGCTEDGSCSDGWTIEAGKEHGPAIGALRESDTKIKISGGSTSYTVDIKDLGAYTTGANLKGKTIRFGETKGSVEIQ